MEWSGQRTGHRQRSQWNGDHSRRMAAIRFYLLSRRQFSAHPKSSRSRVDKRTARAARNTRTLSLQQNRPSRPQNDNCVSLARTNTVSSTITKPVKTWKTSNESCSYNLLNRINKMYTHDLFYLQQEWEAWLAPVYKQIRTTKSQLTQCTKNKCQCNLHRNKEHAPTVKMVHNNYNTTLCKRSNTNSKTSTKTIGANFRLGRVILVAAALIVILSSLWIQLSSYSTQYLIS